MNNKSMSENDKIDFQIVDLLMENERITAAEIARCNWGIIQRGEYLPHRRISVCSANSENFFDNGNSPKGGE